MKKFNKQKIFCFLFVDLFVKVNRYKNVLFTIQLLYFKEEYRGSLR